MNDFSIEDSIEKITSQKTKEYFIEVSSSYYNKNYRAAIVTLYSVVINDILIKLEHLEEIYSDDTAISILQEIKSFQESHPTNPEWEKDVIEKVKNRTNLIDSVDYAHLIALRNHRHLCAHPVIDKEDKLFTPNKETVASHIRNMLESLFLKPAVLSKKILTTILLDIASKKDLLIDEESLERYVLSKYLHNSNLTTEIAIFRGLWKIVFKVETDESKKNRIINYRLLYFIYKRNTKSAKEKIKSEKDYFSNISDSSTTLLYLVRFLSENEFLYNEFKRAVHLQIEKLVKENTDAKTVAWFLEKDFETHLKNFKKLIKSNFEGYLSNDASSFAYQRIINIGLSKGYTKELTEFIIWRYSSAENFNDADKIFAYVISPNLKYFKDDQLLELCEKSNENGQVYGRKKAEEDHKYLKVFCVNRLGDDFDAKKYPNLF